MGHVRAIPKITKYMCATQLTATDKSPDRMLASMDSADYCVGIGFDQIPQATCAIANTKCTKEKLKGHKKARKNKNPPPE